MQLEPFSLKQAVWPAPMSLEAHLRRIGALFDETYEYFQVPLPAHVRRMYAEDVAKLTFAEVSWAIEAWRRLPPPENQVKRPPKPLDLINLVHPSRTPLQEANAIASHIYDAIRILGYNKPLDAVKAHLGPSGWRVVKMMGGDWASLCRDVNCCDHTIWHAQLRERALAVVHDARREGQQAELNGRRQIEKLLHVKDKAPGLTGMADILQGMPKLKGADAEPHDIPDATMPVGVTGSVHG